MQPGGFGGRLWHCSSNPACRSSADHLDKPENRTAGLDTDPWREEVSQQVLLQWHERPGKGVSFDRKTERFHGLQKVLRLNREGSFRLEGAFLCIIAFYRAPPRRSGPRGRPAPGRHPPARSQQRHPHRVGDAQAGEEVVGIDAGKLLFQVHGEHPFMSKPLRHRCAMPPPLPRGGFGMTGNFISSPEAPLQGELSSACETERLYEGQPILVAESCR